MGCRPICSLLFNVNEHSVVIGRGFQATIPRFVRYLSCVPLA
jgi:hypothetical protein